MSELFSTFYLSLLKLAPATITFAAGGASDIVNRVIQLVGGIGGAIVALFLIISLIKDGIGLAKGTGDSSVVKIVTKIIFLIIILGLIVLAMNYSSLTNMGQVIANKGLGVVDGEINNALG